MGIIVSMYEELFFKPLFNGLVFLTSILPFHDLGLSIIVLTIIVRIIIFPFTHRSVKTQVKMKEIEPQIREMREKFKNNQQELAKKTMELYREHGVSPFSGCMMLFVQFPVLLALYHIFTKQISSAPQFLYSFISVPSSLHVLFLGFIDLTKINIIMALASGISQFIQMKLAMPQKDTTKKSQEKNDFSRIFSSQAIYIFPIMITIISFRFPSALPLYWTTSNLFAIVHESIVRKKSKHSYSYDSKGNTTTYSENNRIHS